MKFPIGSEKLNSFSFELTERFRSPFLFSYSISFFLYHYKLWILIFLYNKEDLFDTFGFANYLDAFELEFKCKSAYFWPLLPALIYTLFYPILKMGITAFTTYINKKSTDWNLKIAKDSTVSIDKYMTLRGELLNKKKELEDLIKSEKKFINEKDEALQKLEDEKRLTNEYQIMLKRSFIFGKWNVYLNNEVNKISFILEINSNTVSVIYPDKNLNYVAVMDFYFKENSNIYFGITRQNNQTAFYFILYEKLLNRDFSGSLFTSNNEVQGSIRFERIN